MNVFLTWSGSKSRRLAEFLRQWLADVIQDLHPWMSSEDIRRGAQWPAAIGAQLESSDIGVICVTRDNQEAPWLLFEAGALGKRLTRGARVCTYLLDLSPADLKPGPLSLYQATQATQEDTLRLLITLNEALGEARLPEQRLRKAFDHYWPELHAHITFLNSSTPPPAMVIRPDRELLEEILLLLREIARNRGSVSAAGASDVHAVNTLFRALQLQSPSLAADLAGASRIEFVNGELVIWLPKSDPSLAAELQRPARRDVFESALSDAFGQGARWRVELL